MGMNLEYNALIYFEMCAYISYHGETHVYVTGGPIWLNVRRLQLCIQTMRL